MLVLAACFISRPLTAASQHTIYESIPPAYVVTANLYGVPPMLLYAVALQESGRTVSGLHRPWPWTLNVDGRAYYYDTKTEMWDGLRAFVLNGRTNIGIGLLQVTWPYNQHVLSDVYAAIEPYTNLRMGALILAERYQESGDWWVAVGHYHSPGTDQTKLNRAAVYRASVQRRWEKLSSLIAETSE